MNKLYEEYNDVVNMVKDYIRQEQLDGVKDIASVVSERKEEVSLSKDALLDELSAGVSACRKCSLGKSRIKAVFGDGNPDAELVFVGEGPGYDEDRQGLPFVGRAGQLLTKIIEAIDMKRPDVYIANIVKCHPMKDPSSPDKRGNDRPPTQDEANTCKPFLFKQIEIIQPKIVCALGTYSAQLLLNTKQSIGSLRGRFYDASGIKIMPTLHPASCLYQASNKKYVWADMKMIRDELKRMK
ncbi:MAG: uracil-DNA glycosylase [bacterium]